MDIYVVYEQEEGPLSMVSVHATKELAEIARLMHIAQEKEQQMEDYGEYNPQHSPQYHVYKAQLITSDEELLQFFKMRYSWDGPTEGE
jgi:hypothetical protein